MPLVRAEAGCWNSGCSGQTGERMLLAHEETAPQKEPGVWPGPHLGVHAGQILGLPSEPHCQGVGKGGLWPQPGSWAPLLRALWEQLPPEVRLKPEPFLAPPQPYECATWAEAHLQLHEPSAWELLSRWVSPQLRWVWPQQQQWALWVLMLAWVRTLAWAET